MKATINRIAILAMAFLPFWAFAQQFPSSVTKSSPSQSSNPKLQQGQSPKNVVKGTTPPPAVYPVCAFDEMNAEHCLEDHQFQEELQRYLKDGLPLLAASGGEKSAVEPLLTVSVVVHVIHNGEPVGQGQNISDAQVLEQIAVLNEDFASLNSQFYNTPSQWMGVAGFPNIQFCLATKKPDGSATNGIDRRQMAVTGTSWNNNNINSTIKPATNWNPNKYFNIYVLPIPGTTAQGGVVGYSNYPVPGQIGGSADGLVIDYRWFGGPSFPVSGYRPVTHETGHYLGLPHPFNGNSCSLDDGISDTPNIDGPTRDKATLNCENSYPAGPVSCGNEHMYVNYMDYVTENCYTSFTAEQVNVMRAVLNGTSNSFGYGSRNGLIQNAPQQCSIPATDAGITRLVSPNNISCTNGSQLTPVVSLRNFGTNDLTAVTIKYKVNNGAVVNYNWQGNLFPGENEDVSLAPFMPSNGNYSLTFWTSQPNGQTDQRISNDSVSVNRFTYLATAPPSFENVESETGFPTSEGIFDLNVSNDVFTWQVTNDASGYGQGSTAFVFDNYNDINGENPLGTIDALITRHFDFTNVNDATLKFDVAYAPYIEDVGDSLIVLVATNCSQVFNAVVYRKGGVELSTAPTTTSEFTPTAAQWRTETIDLSAFDGMSDVTIALVNKSAFGNRLFLDNIGIGRSCNALSTNLTNVQADGCSSACDGAATVQVANANGAVQYAWAGAPNIVGATNTQLCSGSTTVTVTDAIGCTKTVEVQITGMEAAELSTGSTMVTGFGLSNGTATVNIQSGTGPFTYIWSNGQQFANTANTSSTISNLATGTYQVTVTDGSGCATTASMTVGSVCDGFGIANITPTMVSCFGGNNGSIIVTPLGGAAPFAFNWSNGQTTATATNLTAGTYLVTVTSSNGCPATTQATVTQPTLLSLSIAVTPQTQNGVNNGSATASATGGVSPFQYAWSNGMSGPSIGNLAPGSYTVTVTDANGCTATSSTTVNPVSCGSLSGSLNLENLDCFGANTGAASVAINGGSGSYNYQWFNGATASQIGNLPAGSVGVTITDGIGCVLNLDGTITQPTQLLANASATEETLAGAANGSASVAPTGGVSPYTIHWGNGASTSSITGLAPGNYAYTITDANNCVTSGQVNVSTSTCFITLALSAIPTTCPDLANGSATVTVSAGGAGPFTYLWSNGGTTSTVNQLTTGVYSVTVSDGAGCSESGEVSLSSNDTAAPSLSLYNQASISLDENGQYSLSPADLVETSSDNCSMVFLEIIPETLSCENLGTVQITVKATDSSGNTVSKTTTVSVLDEVAPSITCPPTFSINTCEAITYAMPTATDNCSSAPVLSLLEGEASGSIFPVGTTKVTWQATDASGNASQCSFEVTVISDLEIEALAKSPSCHGYSDGALDFNITGGQAPYDLNWNSPFPQNQLPAGNYFVTVTDAAGCSKIKGVDLTEPDEIFVNVNNIEPATTGQSNGIIDFTVFGGTAPYTINWLKGGVILPNFNPDAAPAGSYQIRVLDNNGCIYLSGLIVVTTVSSSAEKELEQRMVISPNPSSGLFYLQTGLPLNEPIHLEIFEATGSLLLRQPIEAPSQVIDLQAFGSGVYWAKIQMGEAVVWRRLVKI
ncbi:MAG: T9SS type A sorting domain-containing protein [Saprospiraceae bacterium]|nr:T9SS type A sorting domain-containing protein [Saprospiraceae bacterium]